MWGFDLPMLELAVKMEVATSEFARVHIHNTYVCMRVGLEVKVLGLGVVRSDYSGLGFREVELGVVSWEWRSQALLWSSQYGVYGDLIIIYTKPYCIYLRGTNPKPLLFNP